MQRAASTLLGLAMAVLAIWAVARGFHAPKPMAHPTSATDSGEDDGGGLLFALADAGAATAPDDAGPLLISDLVAAEPRGDGGVGGVLFDGSPVPGLPLNAPRVAHFGVVLVSYAGAQPSASGGRPPSRSRADAKALAVKLAASAHEDFHAAVQQGDSGSADDLGTVKLGVLEPAPEYVLFTLPVGGVGGPVDTPRGYWIVKRLE